MTVQTVNRNRVLELHIYHSNMFSINFRFKEIHSKMHYLEVLALKKDRRDRKSALFFSSINILLS